MPVLSETLIRARLIKELIYHALRQHGNPSQGCCRQGGAKGTGNHDRGNCVGCQTAALEQHFDPGAHRPLGQLEVPDVPLGQANLAAGVAVAADRPPGAVRHQVADQVGIDLVRRDNPAIGREQATGTGGGQQGQQAAATQPCRGPAAGHDQFEPVGVNVDIGHRPRRQRHATADVAGLESRAGRRRTDPPLAAGPQGDFGVGA
jgi:hypothetical protein